MTTPDPIIMRTLAVVGCTTDRSSAGLHVFDTSDPDEPPRPLHRIDGIEQPSMTAAHPSGRWIYAVSECALGELVALRLEPDGSLVEIDRASSHGSAPCHVSVTRSAVYVANYVSGTVAAHRLAEDGRFSALLGVHEHAGRGPHPRQDGPHAHGIVPAPDGRFVLATDLGTDRVHRYSSADPGEGPAFTPIDETGTGEGSGPRHITFHPHRPIAFVIGELDSTVTTFGVDPTDGHLTPLGRVSTLPTGFDRASIAAEIRVHPNGRFVYASNRGHDSIAVFTFEDDHRLTPIGHVASGGRHPRNFAIHPSGRSMLVANQHSDALVHFAIDEDDGRPGPTGSVITLTAPAHVTYVDPPEIT